MIATRRGLAIVVGVAAVLAIALGVDLSRRTTGEDRALLPGFEASAVAALVWKRPGAADVELLGGPGRWRITRHRDLAHAIAPEPSAVQDVLDTLRSARWHRRGAAMPSHASLEIEAAGARHVIGLGEPLPGGEQVWLTVDGEGRLVDRWVARALEPDRLRQRLPLEAPTAFAAIELGDVALAPRPWRLTRPTVLWLAVEPAAELEEALAAIDIVRFAEAPASAHGLTIHARGDGKATPDVSLTIGGACPGAAELVSISGSSGDGCVTAEVAARVTRAVAALSGDPAAIVERRPAPVEPATIQLPDGATLDVVRGRIDNQVAEPARVAELIAALSLPGAPAPRPKSSASSSKIIVTDRRGAAIRLELFGGGLITRDDEPLALQLAPGAIAVLTRSSHVLRDLGLWLEEPTTISALTVDDVHFQRGATLDDWTRTPAGPVDPAAVATLIAQLAAPRGLAALDAPIAARHQLSITITQPVGGPIRHALTIGASRSDGCPAQLDDRALLLPAALCAAVDHIRPK